MIKFIVNVEDETFEGLASIIKMSANADDKSVIHAALDKIKKAEIANIDPDAFGEDKTTLLMSMLFLAIGTEMP